MPCNTSLKNNNKRRKKKKNNEISVHTQFNISPLSNLAFTFQFSHTAQKIYTVFKTILFYEFRQAHL